MSRRPLIARALFVLVAFVGIAAPRGSYARSVLSSAPSATELRANQVSLLVAAYKETGTSRYTQLTKLLPEVAGHPSYAKYVKYGGNFRNYWRAAESSFLGKGFEAIIAHGENESRIAAGRPNRIVVTAAHGFKHDPADLLEIMPDGRIIARYQAKLGAKAAMDAVLTPKYSGMKVLTTPESLERIRQELVRRQVSAAGRKTSLNAYWQTIADALSEGRLTDRLSDGLQAPSRRETGRIVRHWLIVKWRAIAQNSPSSARFMRAVARLGQMAPAVTGVSRALGKVVIVFDIAGTGYAEFQDVQRFRAGEIGGGYLTFKSGLRVTQLSLTYYAVTSPEPVTKLGASIAAGVLVVVDIASDPVHAIVFEKRQAAARALLESVDREERYHAARHGLLHEIHLLGQLSASHDGQPH